MASRARKIDQQEPAPSSTDEEQELDSGRKETTAPASAEKKKRNYAEEWRRRKKTHVETGLAGGRSGPKTKQAKIDVVRESLTQTFVDAGAGLSFVMPTAGMYVATAAERRANTWIAAAQQYPFLMPYLEKIGPTTVLLAIGTDVAAIAVAIAVDLQRVDPYSPVAQTLRVTQAFEIAHAEDPTTKGPADNGTNEAGAARAPDFLRAPAVEATR